MNNYTGGSALTTPFKGAVYRGRTRTKGDYNSRTKRTSRLRYYSRHARKNPGKIQSDREQYGSSSQKRDSRTIRGLTMNIDEIIEDEISSTKEEKPEKGAATTAPTSLANSTNEPELQE